MPPVWGGRGGWVSKGEVLGLGGGWGLGKAEGGAYGWTGVGEASAWASLGFGER